MAFLPPSLRRTLRDDTGDERYMACLPLAALPYIIEQKKRILSCYPHQDGLQVYAL